MTMEEIAVGDRRIGPNRPCFIIGEIAQAHDGSLGMAHAFIDAIANAGADAVKFQTHIAAAESTLAEPWRVKFSLQDHSRYDYWERMEFTEEQWIGLKRHADQVGLVFLSSPFSVEAVEMLDRLEMPAWKVASGEIDNPFLLERMAETGKPALLSSGMSSFDDLDAAVELFRGHDVPVAVFQCTTAYPCPPEKVGLRVIEQLKRRYDCPVGLSDHSGTTYAGLAAVALEAQMLEVHVAFSRKMFGPDVPASLTTAELQQLVDGARFIERSLTSPVDKESLAAEMDSLRCTFGKSIVATTDLPKGTILGREHLTAKKPGTGIPAKRYREVLGRRLTQDVPANRQLEWDMLGPEP